jgi:hypothetical protein
MRYTIHYDLLAPETTNDYKKLGNALTEIGAKKLLYSGWVVTRYNTTAAGLRDYLWQFMDSNDRLIVQEVDGTGWASMNTITKISDVKAA